MSSPLGHACAGAIIGLFARGDWKQIVLTAFAAMAADLDFIPGLVLGAPKMFHRGASHSVVVAIMFSGVAGAAFWMVRLGHALRWGSLALAGYASHLLLDYFVWDPTPPYGAQFLWPISREHYISPVAFLPGVHYMTSDGKILPALFSYQNLGTLLFEVLFFLPFFVVFMLVGRARRNLSLSKLRGESSPQEASNQGQMTY